MVCPYASTSSRVVLRFAAVSPGTNSYLSSVRGSELGLKGFDALRQMRLDMELRKARLVNLDPPEILECPGGKVAKHDVVMRCRPGIAVERLPKCVLSG